MQKIPAFIVIFLTIIQSAWALSYADARWPIIKGNNQFAFGLYSKLKKKDGNLFFSPFSISTALAMTYAGAGGNTKSQMAQILHFAFIDDSGHQIFSEIMNDLQTDSAESSYELTIANALWGQKGEAFKETFIDIANNFYKAGFKEIDFKETEFARQTINGWVSKKTKNKIEDLIPPGILSGFTRLVLTNAIYFKGKWVTPFKNKNTMPGHFQLIKGEKIEVPMMNQKNEFNYSENKTFQILELPYTGNKLSMVIFLPKEINGIGKLENLLNVEDLKTPLLPQKVNVFLPKFKMTSEFLLSEELKALGITDAFDPQLADFSRIGPTGLFISEAIHKAFVDVNEEGTEAAAATALVTMLTSLPSDSSPIVFRADHPFIFIILDRVSNNIFFMGRIMDPRR